MDMFGFDLVSVMGMVVGGVNIVVFIMGCGSCFGCKFSFFFKIVMNILMFLRFELDMDFNVGIILDGEFVELVGERIFVRILEVVSGVVIKSEELGIGDEEFIFWIIGFVF